jgi:hypothetical protein
MIFVKSVVNLVHIWMKFLAMFKSKFLSIEENAVRRILSNFFFPFLLNQNPFIPLQPIRYYRRT